MLRPKLARQCSRRVARRISGCKHACLNAHQMQKAGQQGPVCVFESKTKKKLLSKPDLKTLLQFVDATRLMSVARTLITCVRTSALQKLYGMGNAISAPSTHKTEDLGVFIYRGFTKNCSREMMASKREFKFKASRGAKTNMTHSNPCPYKSRNSGPCTFS